MAGTEISSSVPQPDVEDVLIDPADPQFNGNGEDAEIEAQAREMGWKPFAEYRGTPGRWQPAAQFIERGNEILPIVRANNHRLIERVGRLEGELNGLRATAGEQLEIIKELRERGKTADQRGYDRAMNEIRAKQRQAAEAGDVKTFDQLVEQAEALASERPTAALVAPTPPAVTQPSAPVLSEPTKQFFADNPWMNTKGLLSDTMIAFHQEILNERQATQAILNADPELDRELLDEAKRRVMAKYPERFGLPPMLFGVAGYAIVRETEAEAKRELERITDVKQNASGFANYQQWLNGTQLEQRMSIEEYSVSNRGLRSGLVGTPNQVQDRLGEFAAAGVDLVLLQFSPQHEEMERFGESVISALVTA